MVLTPLQEQWLQALESGEYRQCQEKLHNGTGYCCLGVACVIAGKQFRQARGVYGPDYLCLGEKSYAPEDVVVALGLKTRMGQFEKSHRGCDSLAQMNDKNISFKEIAEYIRKDPENVFTTPQEGKGEEASKEAPA